MVNSAAWRRQEGLGVEAGAEQRINQETILR